MELDITIIEKLETVLVKIRKLSMAISLFAFVQREDTSTWDLVIGGKDIETKDNFDLIAKIIRETLNKNEIVEVPRLVLLNSNHPFLVGINRAFDVEGKPAKLENIGIDKFFIQTAYLFYSKNLGYPTKEKKYELEEKNVKIKDTETSLTTQTSIDIGDKY